MGNQLLHCGAEASCARNPCARRPPGPGAAIDLPPEMLCRRGPCGRAMGMAASEPSRRCDPAGAVFQSSVRQLGELDQAALLLAGSSNVAAIRWLLLMGASPKSCDSAGTTLLHAACRSGSPQMVSELINTGLPLDAADSAGWTALHVASCMGRQDVALRLLRAGASARCRNLRGLTPEELCSQPGTKGVIEGYRAQHGLSRSGRGPPAPQFPAQPGQELGSAMRFEPCFVPREAVSQEPLRCGREVPEPVKQLAIDVFNTCPGHGVAFLVAAGIVRDYPVEINQFLGANGADPHRFGQYLGEDFPLAQNLRLEILNSMPLLGTGVVSALEATFRDVAVPPGILQIHRLAQGIAHFWWIQHDEEVRAQSEDGTPGTNPALDAPCVGEISGFELQRQLQTEEALHGLLFSTLMMQRWLAAGHAMTLEAWKRMNAGIEGGGDVSSAVQTNVYHRIVAGVKLLPRGVGAVTRRPLAAPALEGPAAVLYHGRPRLSHNGVPANFPDVRLGHLAARGGAPSAGRSSCAGGGDVGHGLGFSLSRDDGDGEEWAWLRLHHWFLFFSPATDAADGLNGASPGSPLAKRADEPPQRRPPYAFVSLQHVTLRAADANNRRLVLTRRPTKGKSTSAGNGDVAAGTKKRREEWLDLCLLLADGRFQTMEAPRLQLQFADAASFEAWVAVLGEACADRPLSLPPTPRPRIAGNRPPVADGGANPEMHTTL